MLPACLLRRRLSRPCERRCSNRVKASCRSRRAPRSIHRPALGGCAPCRRSSTAPRLMGFKAMHSTPGVGVGYFVDLYDLPSGELLAMMDADWLTAQRTAATAAIGVDVLAPETVRTVGVLGSGDQARSMLIAASKVRHLGQINVFSPTPAHRQAFADAIGREQGLNIKAVE